MKASTFAAAAAFLGSVSADSSNWDSWTNSASDPVDSKTTSKSVEATSTTPEAESSTWSEWTSSSTPPKVTSTTSEDPSTWSEWSTTSSTPAAKTSTTSQDPSSWSEWTSSSTTSSTPAVKTSTTSSDPVTWSEWSTSSSSAAASSKTSDPATWDAWEPTVTISSTSTQWVTITVYPNDPTGRQTWSEWSTSSNPTVKTTTDSRTVIISSTVTKTASGSGAAWTPASASASASVFASVSASPFASVSASPFASTSASASASSISSAAFSWSAWSSIATPVAAAVDPSCKMEISLSYGPPVWFPTPVIATASANSTQWGAWDGATSSTSAVKTSSTSSTPAVKTSTSTNSATWGAWSSSSSSTPAAKTSTSTDPATWAVWSSSGSSTPVAKTSTSTDPGETWAVWSSTSSTPAAITSTSTDPSTWAVWSSTTSTDPKKASSSTSSSASATWSVWSQSQGGAFYTASASASGSASSASASASASGNAAWSQSTSGISANGNKFGMTYSPYTASSDCKDQATVTSDIAAIAAKGFTSVRVYSTDCSTLEFVGGAAKQYGLKIILGVFISETGISGAQPQVDAIAKWAQWNLVELIVIGNEAVFNSRCSASDLAAFISSAKSTFKGAGFTGKISTTDELSIWQAQGSAWCDVVDVVTANLYAFFNPNTKAEDAGDFIQNQINDLAKVCPGKDVYVMESGWPSAGECNGAACPSPENQATALKGIQNAVGAKVVFFSFEDEQWKAPGQFGVEQHWGCGSVFN